MHTIELILKADGWYSRFSDPRVMELFGTDTIPTAYGPSVPAATVWIAITQRNRDCIVTI